MMRLSELSSDRCRPFCIGPDDVEQGSFAGGSPPVEAIPNFTGTRQKFFATVAFKEFAVSIFYSFDVFENTGGADVIDHNNQALFPSELIHAVVHSGATRSVDSPIQSDMSAHRISVSEWQDDKEMDETDDQVYGGSKIGGKPFIDNENVVRPGIQKLLELGYRHFLQFETPDPIQEEYIEGFPWDPGWLHVFIKGERAEELEFAFVIQQ